MIEVFEKEGKGTVKMRNMELNQGRIIALQKMRKKIRNREQKKEHKRYHVNPKPLSHLE